MNDEEFQRMAEHVKLLVADGFAATTDGSAQRAGVLAERAWGNIQHILSDKSIGWWTRRKLRRIAEAEIAHFKVEVTDA